MQHGFSSCFDEKITLISPANGLVRELILKREKRTQRLHCEFLLGSHENGTTS